MKKNRLSFRINHALWALAAGIVFFSYSCTKDSDNEPIREYVVRQTKILNYPLASIQVLVSVQMASYPEAADIVNHIKYGVDVYRVNYKTHYGDSVVTASGLVCIPDVKGSFPVMSFQNGTNASHAEAPTINPTDPGYVIMQFMASNGYAVLMTDYIGFDASADIVHPYYQRECTNNAVIDLIHAYMELSESGDLKATPNDSLFLLGYSQGGEATISTTEKIEHNSPLDMDLIAVSAGAGAYDLMAFTNYVLAQESFPAPMYFPYFIYSHQQFGTITSPLSLFFKEPYASQIPDLFDGSQTNADINESLPNPISDLLTPDLIQNFGTADEFEELRNELTSSSIHGWKTNLRIQLYHGTADDNVPPDQSLNLFNEFIAAGSSAEDVQHFTMEGLGHGTGLMPWGIGTVNWFNSLR
jgi:pimeloyl-ACP methyl ester carboxylesterase